jgi:ribonuclease Z
VGDDDPADAYALVPIELDWRIEGGVAYDNPETGVKITHFPAIHAREGSISYKLEWNGLSMIFTGDTKPNNYVIRQATAGVDVLIHEITTSAEVWAENFVGIDPASPYWEGTVQQLQNVQDSSHTPQKAFGYILSQLAVPPGLAVGTHFPVSDDTVEPALADIRKWYTQGEVVIALDFLVLNVSKTGILQRRAVVSDFAWPEVSQDSLGLQFEVPKYNDGENADPIAQLDPNRDEITGSPWENR